jgi:hypothetical protein
MTYCLNKNEIAIILRPNLETGEWKGEIGTGLVVAEQTEDEHTSSALDMAISMVAFINLLEDDPLLMEDLVDYKLEVVKELFPSYYDLAIQEVDEEAKANSVEKKGNVYTINKWTKTEGSA